MPFETTFDNTQEVIASVALSNSSGADVAVTGLLVAVESGDGSFSMTADDGTPLPINQVRLVSGNAAGDTVYTANIQNAVRSVVAQIVTHIIDGVLSTSISFGTPTPKPTP